MSAKRPVRILFALVAFALVASCEVGPRTPVSTKHLVFESSAYADPEKQSRFKSALKTAGIEHEVYTGDDGREYLRWKGEDSAKVERIKVQLFGEPLPEGRHIHFGAPHHEWFKKWLADSRIPFTTRQVDGKEYVIWEAADYARVSQWEYFPRDTYDSAQRLSSEPTSHPDPPDVSAPAGESSARAGLR
jgi:hypothetical protein